MIVKHDPSSCSVTHRLRYQGETDYHRFRTMEWLVTDGLGGYASGTALGLNTRRYHGLHIHAASPPVGRQMLLSNLLDRFVIRPSGNPTAGETEIEERIVDLSTFEFQGPHVAPRGYVNLEVFERGPDHVRWEFTAGEHQISRTLRTKWRKGGSRVTWEMAGPPAQIEIILRPMLRLRNYHKLLRHGHDTFFVRGTMRGIRVESTLGHSVVHLATSAGQFFSQPDWWFNFLYEEERLRGQEDCEDLFTPGEFRTMLTLDEVHAVQSMSLYSAVTENQLRWADEDESARSLHLKAVVAEVVRDHAPSLSANCDLIAAGDDFVAPRTVKDPGTDGTVDSTTILAGYPWFGDWGRDTMIALEGLLIDQRRYSDALRTLRTFAANLHNGLIPNLFDDYGGVAHYNTVDASLWFIHAACRYARVSGDFNGFNLQLAPACLEIIDHYRKGTDYAIRMDPADSLISAGEPSMQLTWMDAKRDGIVFTPRYGKAVEINALWYNALRGLAELIASIDSTDRRVTDLNDSADCVQQSFAHAFWCEEMPGLADCLVPGSAGGESWVQDRALRPNQIFAVSLPYSPVTREMARRIVRSVENDLLTPMGLRTLSPRDSRYLGRYEGNMFSRDRAYHQGTVWPWLLAPFVEATLRIEDFSAGARARARQLVRPLLDEMVTGRSIGQIVEVYDGDDQPPDHPRTAGGCYAQAWSVSGIIHILSLIDQKIPY